MKERIFIATFSTDAVALAKEYGYGLEINDLCISSNLNPENRERVVARIKKQITEVYGEEWFSLSNDKRRKVIFHGPFTELNPAAIDERAVKLMDERYRETIEVCDEFGVKDLVLHDGYVPRIYHKDWHIKKSVEYWKRFSDKLDDGFTVYIENVFDDEPEMLSEIIDKVGRDNIKICLDIGHANCMTREGLDVEDWIKTMGKRISHFHVHNNDGSDDLHNPLEEGTMDAEKIVKTMLREASDSATITIESRNALPDAKFFKNCPK